MRIRPLVVATLVLLAGASSALAAAPNAHTAVDSDAATAQQNQTYEYQRLTIEELELTNVSAQEVLLNETALTRANGSSNSFGTATASNLTIVDATLGNVTLTDVTIRNQSVAQQLFGGETPPEGENATVESAALSETSVDSLRIDSALVETVQITDVRTAVSPGGSANASIAGQPTIEAGNMTVGSANLSSVEADSVSLENASIGLGVLGGGGLGGAETTTNETAAE